MVTGKFKARSTGGNNVRALFSSILQLVAFGIVGWFFYGGAMINWGKPAIIEPTTDISIQGSSYTVPELSTALQADLTRTTNNTLLAGLTFKNRAGKRIEWTFWDAFYFSMEIVTTVGYGDIVPEGDAAKIVTCFFTLVGIGVVSAAIGTIANIFLEKQREMAKAAQMKMLDQAAEIGASCGDVEDAAGGDDDDEGGDEKEKEEKNEEEKEKEEKNEEEKEKEAEGQKKDEAQPPEVSSLAPLAPLAPLPPQTAPHGRLPSLGHAIVDVASEQNGENKTENTEKPPVVVKNVAPMLKDMSQNEIPVKKTKAKRYADGATLFAKKFYVGLKCFIPLYMYIAVCFVLGHMEGWSGVDSFYYSIITLTTVGFGDVTPQTQGGRVVASFLLPIGIITLTIVAGVAAEEIPKVGKPGEKTLKQLLADLQHVIEQDDDGTVSEEEYIIFCLKQEGKVDDDTLDILSKQFKALDADGSGELDEDDVVMLSKKCDELKL